MAEPICEDEGLLLEWTPLTQLLQQIPLKTQRGLFPQNLNLTCVDVVPEFIALGTNLGFVYWYCRANGLLQRLQFENSHCSVNCVKIMPFVDYMVAAGTDQGTVIIFQIPKVDPIGTQEELKSKQKQIERFTVNGLHQAPVTNVEWSPNEMKIFSGDKNGLVVLTEIDTSLHISKSMELVNEKFEIVQLSFNQQILLISTVYRSVICDGSKSWKVHQVGTKERKILGKFGATFCKFQHEVVLYASRPGHRLWLSNKSGIVQQTLIFKSAAQSNSAKIQLVNPIDKKEPYDTSFGKVLQFGDNKLITYNSEILYVLHPGAVSVVSVLNNARKILDLAVNENEIFVLEGGRSLLRIGSLPDKYSLEMLSQPVSRRTSFNLDEFAAKLKDTAVESIKKITKDLIPTTEQTSPNSPPALADEALELPPIVNLPAGLMPTILNGKRIEIHSPSLNNHSFFLGKDPNNSNFLGENSRQNLNGSFPQFNQNCHDEVIIKPLRKRRNKNIRKPDSSQVSESDTASNQSEERLVWGTANDLSLSEESGIDQSDSSYSVLRDISSLLGQQTGTPKEERDEPMLTSDTTSPTSVDTCESVSEQMLIASEAFREEQERTFARLANQPLPDGCNSEKSENMSISLNMTTSSSVSSKISENMPSASYTSDNSEAVSTAKSTESQSSDILSKEVEPPADDCWRTMLCFREEGKRTDSVEAFFSGRNSQRERLLFVLPSEGAAENSRGAIPKNKPKSHATVFPSVDKEVSTKRGSYGKQDSEAAGFQDVNSSRSPQEPAGNLHAANPPNENGAERNNTNEVKNEPLPSEEPLSYGPPSGSSMYSLQTFFDFPSMSTSTEIPNHSRPAVRDSADHWPQYKTPGRITSLAVSKNFVICTDVKSRLYYSDFSRLTLSWKLLDQKASMVRVSSDGSVVWLLRDGSIFALVDPLKNGLCESAVEKIATNVRTFAIDNASKDGLIVTLDGRIIRYSAREKRLCEKEILCDYYVYGIACSRDGIFALSEEGSLLCKLPEEEQFKIVKRLHKPASLAVGPKNFLWLVEERNNIYFSDHYEGEDTRWWQIQISDYIFEGSGSRPLQEFKSLQRTFKTLQEIKSQIVNDFIQTTSVATNENSVWIFNQFDFKVCMNKTGFTGYMWNKVSSAKILPGIEWRVLCAKGFSQNEGGIWLLSVHGSIFHTSGTLEDFQSVPPPFGENVLCLSSSVNVLWVVTESGRIYSRTGLTSRNGRGVSWKEVKTPRSDDLQITWLSCGNDVVWACDVHGRTFVYNNDSIASPGWLEADGAPEGVQFQKVFVGAQLHMVWAIDRQHVLYVRDGIFPGYCKGTSWVCVVGIKAVHVVISTSVWAIASNGTIYRRYGVSESNSMGDYWKSIPETEFQIRLMSSSNSDEMWGCTQRNEIVRLSYNLIGLRETSADDGESLNGGEDVSWEIVD